MQYFAQAAHTDPDLSMHIVVVVVDVVVVVIALAVVVGQELHVTGHGLGFMSSKLEKNKNSIITFIKFFLDNYLICFHIIIKFSTRKLK